MFVSSVPHSTNRELLVLFSSNSKNNRNNRFNSNKSNENSTLPETNVETPKGPYKDYSPSKRGLYWVSNVNLGE